MTLKKLTIAVLFSLVAMTSAYAGTPQQNAIQAYEQAVTQNLDDTNKWNAIGSALEKAGEKDKADAAFDKKYKYLNKVAWAYDNLGLVYFAIGDSDKAIEMYDKALYLNQLLLFNQNLKAAVYGNLGNVYNRKGNNAEKANGYYQIAIKLYKQLSRSNEEISQPLLNDLRDCKSYCLD